VLLVPDELFFVRRQRDAGKGFLDAELGVFGVVGEDYGKGGGPEFGSAGEALGLGEGWWELDGGGR